MTKWFDLASAELPFDRTQLTTARVLQQQLPRLRPSYDLIVVDCPPMQSDVTTAAVIQADLGLVPVLSSPLDVLAYSELVPVLRQAQGVNAALYLRSGSSWSERAVEPTKSQNIAVNCRRSTSGASRPVGRGLKTLSARYLGA